ncbi:hypothetical protein Tco_1502384 [Tanacetum coccineum]
MILFLKLGCYKNPERLKKAIVAQPKMYDGENLHSVTLTIDSLDSEETLEDAEEIRLKMRNKMVQINYEKLNALYETFVPQQEFSAEQTYFSIPSTSTTATESKEVTSDLPIPKMPKESKLLKMFDKMGVAINGLRTRIDKTLLEDRQRRWMSDSQNSLREFYKTDVILMSASLLKNLKELKEELIEEVPYQIQPSPQKDKKGSVVVGIKSILNAVSIIAAPIDVNAAQSKLVLLENFNKNYSKCLRLRYKVNAAEGVNAASKEVSTAELVSTAYDIEDLELSSWRRNNSGAAQLSVLSSNQNVEFVLLV